MTDQSTETPVNPTTTADLALEKEAGLAPDTQMPPAPHEEPGPTNPEFHLGLTMAGAVSAGAYSAGAFDFLIEALAQWEDEKKRDRELHPDRADCLVPDHDVYISVIAGASAGGITGSVGLISLAGGIDHRQDTVDHNGPDGSYQSWQVGYTLPELYEAWVKSPKLLRETSRDKAMLGSHDLDETDQSTQEVCLFSVLDSSVLTDIAHKSLRSAAERRKALAIKPDYRFLTRPTHLFLTLTNLDGVPYKIPFFGTQSGGHYMISHGDRAHYAVYGLSDRPYPLQGAGTSWLAFWKDHGKIIDFNSLINYIDATKNVGDPGTAPLTQINTDWIGFAEATLGTAAFPIGLKARIMARHTNEYSNMAWPIEMDEDQKRMFDEGKPITPAWPMDSWGNVEYTVNFVAVDGGTIDNEPFELARWSVRDMSRKRNPRNAISSDRAVIMIDPFPSEGNIDPNKIQKNRDGDLLLSYIAKALVPALTDQARFKVSDLVYANDADVFSRFLITPSRRSDAGVEGGPRKGYQPALASGLLGGFGGFLEEKFRQHDYQLGRRNARSFLKNYFALHENNPLFRNWSKSALENPDYAVSDPRQNKNDRFRPIIPLCGTAKKPIALPPWPQFTKELVKTKLRKQIMERFDKIAKISIAQASQGRMDRFGSRVAWKRLKIPLTNNLIATIRTELYWTGQITSDNIVRWYRPDEPHIQRFMTDEDYRKYVNAFFGAIYTPHYKFRTLAGIAHEYKQRFPKDPISTPDLEKQLAQIAVDFKKLFKQKKSRGPDGPVDYSMKTPIGRKMRNAIIWPLAPVSYLFGTLWLIIDLAREFLKSAVFEKRPRKRTFYDDDFMN